MTPETQQLLTKFEAALGWAWQADGNERTSDKRLREVWTKAAAARKLLADHLDEVEESAKCLAESHASGESGVVTIYYFPSDWVSSMCDGWFIGRFTKHSNYDTVAGANRHFFTV